MTKLRAYLRILVCGLALQVGGLGQASADWLYTPGGGPSKFFSYNASTTPVGTGNCAASNVDCMAYVPVNTAGAQLFSAAVPGVVSASGGSLAVTGTFFQATQPVSASALPLPTGAATSALQTTGNTALTTLNTTLGSPFQAGASVGNTGFNALQAGTANIAGNPFFVSPGTGATFPISAASLPLPTGAATQTTLASLLTALGTPFQAGGSIGNTSFIATQSTAANLNMTCANCSGSGASGTDKGGFTSGSSVFAPVGGFFQTTPTTNPLTTGQWGTQQLTAFRAGMVNLRDASANELGIAASPLRVDPTGTTTQPVSASALPLPTGAATQTTLASLLTALGTPFQAGGSIGNTSFAVTNAGTFAAQLTGATNNINNIAGTVSLPTGASTSANQTNASAKTQIVDGSGNVIASTSNNLNVQCANCSGSGVSAADAATFTAGTSLMAPIGAQFTSGGATACVTGHECTVGMTAARQLFTDTSTVNGVTVLTGTGAVGTGAQRIAVGTDTATIAGSAPGTAGTPSTNVVSVQGVGSGTNLPVSQATAANLNATVVQATGSNLHVVCDSGCSGSGGTSAADAATFTAGTSNMTPMGGQFTSGGATACVTGHECTVAIGSDRTLFAQLPHAEVAVAGATAPADAIMAGMMYNSGGVTPSNGQGLSLQSDAAGNLKVVGVGVAQGSTTSGQTGSVVFGAVTTSAPSYTTAQSSPLSLDTAGNVRTLSTIAQAGSALSATNPLFTNVSVASAAISATNPLFTNISVGSAAISATNPLFGRIVPTTAGGTTSYHLVNASGTNSTLISTGAHTVYGAQLGSIAGPAFLKIYDKSTAPTCGTDTPIKTLIIPVAGTAANGAGSNVSFGDTGVKITNGLGICATGAIADADTTSLTATTVTVNLDYL